MYGKEIVDKVWGPRGWVSIGHQYVDETKTEFVISYRGTPKFKGERHHGGRWTALLADNNIHETKTMADMKVLVAKL